MICPECNCKLSVSYIGAMIVAVVLWSLVDIFLLALMFSWLGDTLPIHAGRIVISGLVGFTLVALSVKSFATVRCES